MNDFAVIVVGVFGLFHSADLAVKPAGGEVRTLRLAEMVAPFRLAPADFRLSVPGKIERRFRGRLDVRPDGGELLATVTMDLETAVASVVAAESPADAPLEALKAQAVAARSFYIAARGRHRGFDFCDTTHCQFLRQPPGSRDPAWLAAAQTRGLILRYQGRALPALYSADCGGRTDPQAHADGYPYFAVTCPRKGERRGHGLGLCQEGGAAMAHAGADFRTILAHYYPNTQVGLIQ